MASYGADYQPANPRDDYRGQLMQCDKVFAKVVHASRQIEPLLTQANQERQKDLRAKYETLKGVEQIYAAVKDLLETKSLAIGSSYDLSVDGSEEKDQFNKVYVEMKQVLDILQIRLYRILGLPDSWFGLNMGYVSSWVDENPRKALGLVVAGGAILGGGAAYYHAANGFCLFYRFFYGAGNVCACNSWGMAASAALGAGTGVIFVAVAVLCAQQLVRTVKYKAAADPTDLQQALEVVEHVKKLPDAEFINQLSKICFDNYGQFPSDPQVPWQPFLMQELLRADAGPLWLKQWKILSGGKRAGAGTIQLGLKLFTFCNFIGVLYQLKKIREIGLEEQKRDQLGKSWEAMLKHALIMIQTAHLSLLFQTHDALVGACGIITSSIDCYAQVPFKPKAQANESKPEPKAAAK
ncbi:unnamed protein product [Effrenium voratum]|uniref:Uncharacterized protein n=1 Tax=Effrenium voratum TaxID=2562239 RepID=A0AA36J9N3_9DINO|nr:unnamed protein product [Effrenium voratum]